MGQEQSTQKEEEQKNGQKPPGQSNSVFKQQQTSVFKNQSSSISVPRGQMQGQFQSTGNLNNSQFQKFNNRKASTGQRPQSAIQAKSDLAVGQSPYGQPGFVQPKNKGLPNQGLYLNFNNMGDSSYKKGGVFQSNRSPDHLLSKNYDSNLMSKSPYTKSQMGLQYSQNNGAVSEFAAMQGHLLTDGNQSITGKSQHSNGTSQSNAEMNEQHQYKKTLHTNMTQRVLHKQKEREMLQIQKYSQSSTIDKNFGFMGNHGSHQISSRGNQAQDMTPVIKKNKSNMSLAKNNFNQVPPKKYKGNPQQVQEKKPQSGIYQNVLSNRLSSKQPDMHCQNPNPQNQIVYKIKYIQNTGQNAGKTTREKPMKLSQKQGGQIKAKSGREKDYRPSVLSQEEPSEILHQQSILVQKPRRYLKFGGDNCDLDPRIVMTLLEFDMTNFRKFLRLSPNWHHLVLEGIEERMKPVEIDFVNKFYEHLFFKKSYTNSSIMYFGGKRGIRVDRILVCEVLDQREQSSYLSRVPKNYHLNKCLNASFKYKFTKGSQYLNISTNGQQGGISNSIQTRHSQPDFCADYKMDIIKKGSNRILWMHKDEQEQQQQLKQIQDPVKFDYMQISQLINRPYIQPINQICHGDTIEIAINLFNMQGMIDIDSIQWFPPILTQPTQDNVLTYSNDGKQRAVRDRVLKIFCDTNRVCELEDSVVEWYDSKYFQRQHELIDLSFFSPFFKVESYMCAGIDGLISKIHLIAQQEGRLVNEYIGMPLVVKSNKNIEDQFQQQTPIVHEVKRVGLLIDRYIDLELRVGDHLVLYISKSQA